MNRLGARLPVITRSSEDFQCIAPFHTIIILVFNPFVYPLIVK